MNVVQIRDYQPKTANGSRDDEPATVFILPMVRIERTDEAIAGEISKRLRRRLPRLLTLKQKMDALRKLQETQL